MHKSKGALDLFPKCLCFYIEIPFCTKKCINRNQAFLLVHFFVPEKEK